MQWFEKYASSKYLSDSEYQILSRYSEQEVVSIIREGDLYRIINKAKYSVKDAAQFLLGNTDKNTELWESLTSSEKLKSLQGNQQ